MSRSGALTSLSLCPLGYFNGEGESLAVFQMDEAARQKAARGLTWDTGFVDRLKTIDKWTAKDPLSGIHFKFAMS